MLVEKSLYMTVIDINCNYFRYHKKHYYENVFNYSSALFALYGHKELQLCHSATNKNDIGFKRVVIK